jgi:hypothetical protein
LENSTSLRELPHGDWVALNVPGDVGVGHDASDQTAGGGGRRRHGGVVEHSQTYKLSGLAEGTSYEVRITVSKFTSILDS